MRLGSLRRALARDFQHSVERPDGRCSRCGEPWKKHTVGWDSEKRGGVQYTTAAVMLRADVSTLCHLVHLEVRS